MDSRMFEDIPIMWKPNENSGKQMKQLMKTVEKKYSTKFDNYWDFQKWSVDNIAEFWAEIWDYAGIIHSKKYNQVIDLTIPMEKSPKWFEGAELNYAENLLKYRDERVALILAGEDKETEELTYAQMYDEARLYAAAFRKHGIKKGDVVVCYMSNRKEAVLAMLATVSIGAIWTGALPQLGPQAVLNRLSQVDPKILVTVDRFLCNGEEVDMFKNLEEIVSGLPTLEKVLIVPSKENSRLKDIAQIRNSCFMDEFLKYGMEVDGSIPHMEFEQVSISHPVYISFTSGTTGLPKPIMHGTSILLSVTKDYGIHCNSTRDSTWFSISPVGWGSWSLFTTFLFIGSTLVLFEGNPYILSPTSFWDLIDDYKLTNLFIQVSVVDELEKKGHLPTENHKLTSLKTFFVGGSVVKPTSYDFMYKTIKTNYAFSSSYACTETMSSCFLMEQTLPVYRGEINSITLGYAVECLNQEGDHVLGERGELVLTKPVPNLLLGLWGDTDGSKFREKYFSKYPGKFLLGDHGIFNPVTKGIYICGRSDETLKQRGCRFGSSEIYNVVDCFPEVRDSLCASQYNKDMEERAVLFLKMREGYLFHTSLVTRIREAITKELTARHVPDVIIDVGDIPYNINGKKMEILVKNIINNRQCNTDTVDNPDSLNYYRNRKELQGF